MPTPHRGYPIGALFVLVAVSAVLVAGVAPLANSNNEPIEGWLIAVAPLAGFGLGTVLGMILGLHYFRRGLAVLFGGAAGAAIGTASGLMCLVPERLVLNSAAAMIAGSGLVIGVALVMRRGDS